MIQNGVVITGSGIICSAGSSLDQCTKNFIHGIPSLHEISDQKLLDGYGLHYAGLIKELPLVNSVFNDNEVVDRHVALAVIAAGEALSTSGIDLSQNPGRVGIIVGTCSGPMLTIESGYRHEIAGEVLDDSLFCFAKQYYSAALILAEQFGIKGPSFTVTTACSAFTVAAGIASDLIRSGLLDAVLVGGSDAHSATTQAGFNGLKATGKGTMCSPFSRPAGLNLGEGSGFLVLESKDRALQRNALVKGELLGYGLSNDAYHCSAPDPAGKGAAIAMQNALLNAKVEHEKIRYINAHGTGTEANDKAETKAIRRVFGDLADSIPVSSLKSVTGHCLGAAGGIELVASLECMKKGTLPPTAHFSEPRDGCTLDYIPEPGRNWNKGNIFLKNNFAFGGNNASLVVSDTLVTRDNPSLISRADDPLCITSVGMLSRYGIGFEAFCEGVRNQGSVGETSLHNVSKVFKVPEFKMSQIDRRVVTKGIDAESEMNIAAASIALLRAGIPDRHPLRQQLGFIMSIAHGSTWAESQHIKPLLKNDFKLEQINAFPYIVPNSISGTVCRILSLSGYNTTFCNGPGAGLTGLGLSSVALLNGHAPAILCGSSDLFSDGTRDCCIAEKIDYRTSQFGDAAVMILLERLSSATGRGVEPICSIESVCFFNTASSKKSNNSPGMSGNLLESMVDDALTAAGISGDKITRICTTLPVEQQNILKNKMEFAILVDVSSSTGLALSCQPLFNLFAALGNDHFETNGGKNYILAVSNAFHGNICIMVVKPYF
jgi:3-oxoacyl-[acyl-carrier-protein] synthase II